MDGKRIEGEWEGRSRSEGGVRPGDNVTKERSKEKIERTIEKAQWH